MSFGMFASQNVVRPGHTGNSAYANAILAQNPSTFLQFDETSGTVANDTSGNNRHGSYDNSPYLGQYSVVPNSPGRSTRFENDSTGPGVAQQVTVPYGAWMNSSEMTIAFPAFLIPVGVRILACRYSEPGNDWSWFLYVTGDNKVAFHYRSDTGVNTNIVSTVVPEQGKRYYVAAYVNTSECGLRVYDSNGLLSSVTGAGGVVNPSSRNFKLMSEDGSDSYKATGYMDELALFSTSLPSATIDSFATLALAPEAVPWMNRVAGTSARNGTTNHTISFTPSSAGSFLVAIVNSAAVHSAVTAGWTKRVAALGGSELAVFTRNANVGDATLEIQLNAANMPLNYVLYEFASGASWHSSVSAGNGGVYPDLTGLPGSPLTIFAANGAARSASGNTPGNETWRYFWNRDFNQNALYDGVTDGVYTSLAYFNDFIDTTASVYQPAQQYTGGPIEDTVLFALSLP